MRRTREGTSIALLAAGLLVLAGCSDSTSPSGNSLDAVEAGDVALTEVDELQQSVATLSPREAVGGALELPGCAEVSGGDDSDGDGTPDERTFTFGPPACHFTGFRGGTLDITGAVVVSDPTPEAPDLARRTDLEDFTWTFTGPDAALSYSAVRNGTRLLSGNASGISLSNTVTIVRSFNDRPSGTVQHNLLVTFTPDAGEVLERGEPLPSGTIEKNGTLTWSRNGRSRTFTVSTVEPLAWDASCEADWKIVSGETRATLGNGSYVRTVWTGCGEAPERTFVPAE